MAFGQLLQVIGVVLTPVVGGWFLFRFVWWSWICLLTVPSAAFFFSLFNPFSLPLPSTKKKALPLYKTMVLGIVTLGIGLWLAYLLYFQSLTYLGKELLIQHISNTHLLFLIVAGVWGMALPIISLTLNGICRFLLEPWVSMLACIKLCKNTWLQWRFIGWWLKMISQFPAKPANTIQYS